VLFGAGGLLYAVWRNISLGVYAAVSAAVVLGWHTQYGYKEFRLVTAVLPLFAIGFGIAANAWAKRFPGAGLLAGNALPAAALACALALSYPAVSRTLHGYTALGEPSFLDAMSFARGAFPASALLLGENQAQIDWYADRPTLRIGRDDERIAQQLRATDWLVITNFERGQPAQIGRMAETVTVSDQLAGDVYVFRDSRFFTILAKSEWALRQLQKAK
jgi:hypothetical protein